MARVLEIGMGVVLLAAVIACTPSSSPEQTTLPGPSAEAGDPTGLVWEAWSHISRSYSDWNNVDFDRVQGEAIAALLEVNQAPPYPFLADVGKLRGQPPAGVPPEMSDVWRSLVLHQAKWPEVSAEEKAEAVVAGMVAGLDEPSAVVVPAESYEESHRTLAESKDGSYIGIGARVSRTKGGQVALLPIEGSPVHRAGIETGDVLLAVEGKSVREHRLEDLVDLIAGPKGSKVHLLVQRRGKGEPIEFPVFFDDIDIESVSWQLAPGGIGYIRVTQFRENTGEQFLGALEELGRLEALALALDLRTNPGGSLEAALKVAGHFLDMGTVFLSVEDRLSDRVELRIEEEPSGPSLKDVPVVVMINEKTVGEGEALAAALQDNERAVVLGSTSFGRGSANELIRLGNGSAIFLPTSKWFRPSGEPMGSGGVKPDVEEALVENPEGISTDSQFNRAYKILNDILPAYR